MISVISVYNSKDVLEEWLLASLAGQSAAYEFIGVDNTSGRFTSAAAALNWGAEKAKGRYLAFIHQDVRLTGSDWLAKAEEFLERSAAPGVAGVAGMLRSEQLTVWQVGTAPVRNRVGLASSGQGNSGTFGDSGLTAPAAVQTLDEQVLIVPAAVFARLKFDEKVCDDWHLYGVDYALSAAELGFKAYVLPLPANHKSMGCLDAGYFRTLKRLLKKHRACGAVYTTCGSWYTGLFRDCAALLLMAARAEAGKLAGRNTTGGKQSLALLGFLLRSGRGTEGKT